MFGKRRKTRGTLWTSLLGLGISAVVFGLSRSNRINVAQPFKKMMRNIVPAQNINGMNNVALAEFSEELLASALNNDKNRT